MTRKFTAGIISREDVDGAINAISTYHKGENEEVGDCPDYLEGKCAFGEQCMKGHHDDESKLAVQTPPQ